MSCWRNDGASKENLYFDDHSKQGDFIFVLQYFLKEIENLFSVFLSSYRNTPESLGELEKAVEALACGFCPHSISHSPKLSFVFLYIDRNRVHVFYFLITHQQYWYMYISITLVESQLRHQPLSLAVLWAGPV